MHRQQFMMKALPKVSESTRPKPSSPQRQQQSNRPATTIKKPIQNQRQKANDLHHDRENRLNHRNPQDVIRKSIHDKEVDNDRYNSDDENDNDDNNKNSNNRQQKRGAIISGNESDDDSSQYSEEGSLDHHADPLYENDDDQSQYSQHDDYISFDVNENRSFNNGDDQFNNNTSSNFNVDDENDNLYQSNGSNDYIETDHSDDPESVDRRNFIDNQDEGEENRSYCSHDPNHDDDDSYYSGNDDSQLHDSREHHEDDQSYMSNEQHDDTQSHASSDDQSYATNEQNDDDHSYVSNEQHDEDESYVSNDQHDDDRLYASKEQLDDDHSFVSNEQHDEDESYVSNDQRDDDRSYASKEQYDDDHSNVNNDQHDDNHSYVSKEQHDDDHSYVSNEQHEDDQSYVRNEQHDDDHSYVSNEQNDDDQSYLTNEQHDDDSSDVSHEQHDDDQSYVSNEQNDDDQSYVSSEQPDDDQSYVSNEQHDDDQSYESDEERFKRYDAEDQDFVSNNDDDSYISDRQHDDRSYLSDDQRDLGYGENDCDRSHRNDEYDDDDDDGKSYVSNESHDDQSDESGVTPRNEDRSNSNDENNDSHSYFSNGEDLKEQPRNPDAYDDDELSREDNGHDEDQSYVSGDSRSYKSGDNCSYASNEERGNRFIEADDDYSHISAQDDENDNGSYSNHVDDQSCASEDENDDGSYDSYEQGNEGNNKFFNVNGENDPNHSNESMPIVELDEESDTENDGGDTGGNSNGKFERFYNEEPSQSSKINLRLDTSDSTCKTRFDSSRRHDAANQANNQSIPSDKKRVSAHAQGNHPSHYYDKKYVPDFDDCSDASDTNNSNSLNDFDSFAHDASFSSLLDDSRHKRSQIGVGVDVACNEATDDISVLSPVPAGNSVHGANENINNYQSTSSTKSTIIEKNKGKMAELNALSIVPNAVIEPPASNISLYPTKSSVEGENSKSENSSYVGNLKSTKQSHTSPSNSKLEQEKFFEDEKHSSSSRSTTRSDESENIEDSDKENESSQRDSASFAGDETLDSASFSANKTIIRKHDATGNLENDSPDVSEKLNPRDDGSGQPSKSETFGQSLKLPKPKLYNGYNREQMIRMIQKEKARESENTTKRQYLRGREKGNHMIEFAASVNNAVVAAEKKRGSNTDDDALDTDVLLTSNRLLYTFEALAGIFIQLSDELELLRTFSIGTASPSIETLESLLAFSDPLNDAIKRLGPILVHYVTAEIDEELDDFLYGMNLIVDLLCELSHRVGEKQIWNSRANCAFVTLLELLARDTVEVSCIYDDIDTPEYELTELIESAWEATGHIEEVKTLFETDDLFMFRQICYEVMLSTDHWCPDNNILMDICGIDNTSEDGQDQEDENETLASPPEAALQILEKIHGDPLPRTTTLSSVMRRLLPANAIFDQTIAENVARIRNKARNQVAMPPSSLVAITSIPESFDDPDALGVAGVGKTTLAAMVSSHDDILKFFNDGIAWIYVGEIELNYNRYVQCLQDLISQLDIDEDEEPLFPELLHIPGESQAARKRREEGFMIYLRETIVEFLRYRNVLIVLDDVCFEPDLDWFDFAPAPPANDEEVEDEGSYAILVTSRRRNLLPPADTVEVDMLDETEGIKLLIGESGDISRSIDADAAVTKSLVRECAGHPLTIKSVGRWLNLKHATTELVDDTDKIQHDVIKSMEKILKNELQDSNDMMYEILNMSLCPAINGEPTAVIKYFFAAFVRVFCQRTHISDFALADSTPIVPMASTELLFESLLELEGDHLLQEGSLFFTQKNEAAKLIPDVLASLGVFKVIITYTEAPEDSSQDEEEDEKYLQIMHRIQQEYGEHLYEDDPTLTELTKDGERRWNKAFSKAFIARDVEWDSQTPDAGLDYALEMLPSHMMRGGLLNEAIKLLRNEKFIRGRLAALGRENGSRRHIKDSELLFDLLASKRASGQKKIDPKGSIRLAYDTLGRLLTMGEDEFIEEEGSPEAVEVGRCHFEIGFSLAERRCWEGAITHWELSQEFLVNSLGMVELVAGLLFNIAVVNTEMQDYDSALGSLKQCLRIRGAIHGEEHILYAQTIQKIGDVFLAMSDYYEAIESYDWALDVMHIEPSHHRINIGDILEQIGSIHYIKGEIEDSLQAYQDALRSKQIDLGEDHPELAQIFHQIGNCLSNLGKTDEAIAHLEEAIRLKQLDVSGGYERDSDILTIEGILNNLNCKQKEGLECYEKALQILVTKVPHRKEKVAALLHLVGCVYLMSGEQKKALKLFEESLYARRKVLGFVHLEVASTLFNMAFLHQSRNRLDKALKCLEESLRIRQLRLPDSEKVAVTHEKIGNLARAIGKTKKAQNAFNDALRIRKLIHGNSHEAVATVLQELGDLMDDLGEYEDAMKHYVEALEIRENRLGPDDLAVAETYYSMGFTLQNNGALDRALQCLEESLSIRKFQLGDDAKDVGDTLNMMGFLQAKRGELDDALALLWDALRIRKLQNDNVKVSETLNNIGNVHREKQEFDLSIECYEECLRIRRAELGDGHEKVADALIALGNVQSDLEYNEEAMDSFKEALAIRNMIFGEQDESVATVLQFMGTLEFRANELDRAFQLLDEFIRIRDENGTEHDGDYVNVLFMIGNIHKMQGYEDDAKKCWTQAYGVFKKLGLAETNPQIAEVMSNLVKEDGVEASATSDVGLEKTAKNVLGRLTAKVKSVARTANEAGKAVKKVTGMKSKDRGSQLL